MSDDKTKDLKPLPVHLTDEEAQVFADQADLSEYDLSGGVPLDQFVEMRKKDSSIHLRLPTSQLTAIKEAAKQRGVPYTRLIRHFIDRGLQGEDHPR